MRCGAVIGAGGGQLLGGGVADVDEELFTHGPEESFDLPTTLEAVRGECTNRMASFAHARNSQASTNADPLST